jgi:hypothetical protein
VSRTLRGSAMRQLSTLVFALVAATGCARPLVFQPRPMREWPGTLRAVKEAARAGRYARADSILGRFESRHSGSYEGRQAAYWRALLLADPANPQSSPAEAVDAINRYFAGRATAETYDEATILRRILQRVDSLTGELVRAERLIAEAQDAAAEAEARPAAAAPPAAPADTPRPARVNRNLVEQVRRLRDELSKANQELERVRRRLQEQRPEASPPPSPHPEQLQASRVPLSELTSQSRVLGAREVGIDIE